MKEEVKDLWVAALRGGKYEQGKGHLRCGPMYCCLGVLCDLLAVPVRDHGNCYAFGDEVTTAYLPASAMDASGIISVDGSLPGGCESLSTLNDRGTPFLDIATIIEANWQHL